MHFHSGLVCPPAHAPDDLIRPPKSRLLRFAGPLFRTFTYQWLPERYAPIIQENLGKNTAITCPEDTKVLLSTPE